ncbi:Two pore calcium channel protein 1A [Sesamum angolense]|uniref:Two pore calcium channel protein 1A n=1 Tax=Sesamum angolense TaxID=2727404 RepID=A0AAE1W3C8_9LAMI|nr:Two pore calcium channel protein 1A [Sesamum angolense]
MRRGGTAAERAAQSEAPERRSDCSRTEPERRAVGRGGARTAPSCGVRWERFGAEVCFYSVKTAKIGPTFNCLHESNENRCARQKWIVPGGGMSGSEGNFFRWFPRSVICKLDIQENKVSNKYRLIGIKYMVFKDLSDIVCLTVLLRIHESTLPCGMHFGLFFMRDIRDSIIILVGMLLTYLNVLALWLLFLLFSCWLAYVIFEDTEQGKTIFTSYGATLYQMFILFTTSNNPDVWIPAYKASRWYCLFFVLYVLVGVYFVTNLILAVVYDSFKSENLGYLNKDQCIRLFEELNKYSIL